MIIHSKELLYAKQCKYDVDEVIFESSTAGTYSLEFLEDGAYEIIAVGGGGGAAAYATGSISYTIALTGGGGSGAMYQGQFYIPKSTVEIVVGSRGNSSTTALTSLSVWTSSATAGGQSKVGSYLTVGGGGAGSASLQANNPSYSGGTAGTVSSVSSSSLTTTISQSSGSTGTAVRTTYGDRDSTVTASATTSAYQPYGTGSGVAATTRMSSAATITHSYGSAGYIKIKFIK
ncbi:MAG: hypothetical protein R3Y43_01490 [Alphaproteobacteria bacterium]